MSIKSKFFAAAAVLTMAGGIGAAGTLIANAATPSCGHRCIDIFSREFGNHRHPAAPWSTARCGAPTSASCAKQNHEGRRPGAPRGMLTPRTGKTAHGKPQWHQR